jgi:hypothetical protein
MRATKKYLCDRRRRRAIAFWMGLVWVAFAHQGLECLQNTAVKGIKRVCCGWQRLVSVGLGGIF